MRSTPNRVLAIIVGLIVGIALVTVVLSATRPIVKLDQGTPQGTVQSYLSAVLDGKNADAASYLSTNSPCTIEDLDRAYVMHSAQVTLVDVATNGDASEVRVKVELPTGGPFENYMIEDHTLRLIRTGDHWLLVGIPWPLYDCGMVLK
ncbi:MAG TPA: hypothetical protein VMV52_05780 [Candidatus Nanopelagicaceae bacterium]|nr:hypothetical protein [Candidatus Nanopelagicaceae bacterium]